ncbi:hypothetical protein LEP1GSC165_1441 [Leptospira santarosai str. CBC523]|nr:hypothetical protein LEP1GSC165_1441 [Leptospira santarosai str. CBC523]
MGSFKALAFSLPSSFIKHSYNFLQSTFRTLQLKRLKKNKRKFQMNLQWNVRPALRYSKNPKS